MADDDNVIPIRKLPDFSDPIVVLEVRHLDGTVTREVHDRRSGLIFVGWRTDKKPRSKMSMIAAINTVPTTLWVQADAADIDDAAHYLVKTNAGEWRDADLRVMKGYEVKRKREPSYIRGRPVLIARIIDPNLSS